jgi:carbon monoxide dehydrogenase subunit G
MKVQGEHRFDAPRQAVWDVLLDPAALREAMPGVQRFDEVGPRQYEVTLKIGIAAVKGTYSGKVAVKDQAPPESYRLDVEGSGGPGRVKGGATMRLREDGTRTVVAYEGDVQAAGAIAAVGQRLLGGAAKLLINQFFKAMDRQLQERVRM